MKKTRESSSPARKRKTGLAGGLELQGSGSRLEKYVLRLYVSGSTSKSALAVENIKRICEQHLKSRYDLEVVDIYQQPNLARDEQILAVPMLIKRSRFRFEGSLGTCRALKKCSSEWTWECRSSSGRKAGKGWSKRRENAPRKQRRSFRAVNWSNA